MKMIFEDRSEPWPPWPPPVTRRELDEMARLVRLARAEGRAEAEGLLIRAQYRLHCDPELHALATMAAQVAEVEFNRSHPELEPPVGALRLAAAVALLLASEKQTGGVGVDQEQRSDPGE